MLAAAAKPDREFDAVVVGEFERAFTGGQAQAMMTLLQSYGVAVWLPGRYVSLEWASGSTTQYGVLDLIGNQVRSWPVPGMNPSWLGPADVLLSEADAQDTPRTARCDLTADTCVLAPDDISEGVWRGAAWIGS